jgi:hypothetical protein
MTTPEARAVNVIVPWIFGRGAYEPDGLRAALELLAAAARRRLGEGVSASDVREWST